MKVTLQFQFNLGIGRIQVLEDASSLQQGLVRLTVQGLALHLRGPLGLWKGVYRYQIGGGGTMHAF